MPKVQRYGYMIWFESPVIQAGAFVRIFCLVMLFVFGGVIFYANLSYRKSRAHMTPEELKRDDEQNKLDGRSW